MFILWTLWTIFLRENTERLRTRCRIRAGNCSSMCDSRNGTSWSSAEIRNTSHRAFQAGTGRRHRCRPMKRPGAKVWRGSNAICGKWSGWCKTRAPIFSPQYLMDRVKPFCGKRSFWRIITRIISANLWICAERWERGQRTSRWQSAGTAAWLQVSGLAVGCSSQAVRGGVRY